MFLFYFMYYILNSVQSFCERKKTEKSKSFLHAMQKQYKCCQFNGALSLRMVPVCYLSSKRSSNVFVYTTVNMFVTNKTFLFFLYSFSFQLNLTRYSLHDCVLCSAYLYENKFIHILVEFC